MSIETKYTNIIDIIKIKDPTKFFKKNLNSIYVLNSFGLRNYEKDDEIGSQIKNLKRIEYIFNTNEVLIFRTFLPNQIIIYELLENRLHIIKTSLKIINVYLTIDNYILLKYDNFKELEIINYKNFKSLIILSLETNKILLYQNIFDLVFQSVLKHENDFKKFISIKNEEFIELEISKVNKENLENNNLEDFLNEKNNKIFCEKIWGIFILNKDPCYVYSIIENKKRIFKYYININNKIKYFNSIFDMITFLQKEFYQIIKECTLLVQ